MSTIYDNWERLVAAVLKREQIWQLCHEHSRSPSLSSEYSSESSLSFRSTDDEKSDKPKLVFLGCSEPRFRIKHTLKGLRELGKGTFGTTLLTQLSRDVKVSGGEMLEKGTKMSAKLLKVVKVREEEFMDCMMVLQDCKHENVAPPKAYYFSAKTNGKLILYDYHSLGSVSDMLRGKNKHLAGWESRKRVAIGAARGVAHIHSQRDGKMAHGNIKSSNVFLNSEQYGCVSDMGLTSFFIASTGLKTWDFFQERDVFMFGILLMELLTGESGDGGFGLMRWARSLKYEELRGKLLDPRLKYDEGDWLEMVEVVCIAMRCVGEYTICRMCDVVLMLESISRPYKIWGSWM